MLKNKITLSIASAIFMAGFAGCGNDTQTNTLSGQVIGSHYEGAKVCQDTNENYKCDENELSVFSDANGVFELESVGNYPIIAEIGVDAKKHSGGSSTSIVNPITFITMPEGLSEDGKLMLSTVSTAIVAQMISKKLSFENAKMVTALLSGIDTQDILENFVDGGELNAEEKQVLQALADAYLLSLQQANGFTSFVTVQGSTKTVWRDAAINWTATTGLNFASSELTSLLGLDARDPYSQTLSDMLTQLTDINDELKKQTALITNMNSTLTKIYDSTLLSNYKKSIDTLNVNHDKLNTELINLNNIVAEQTNEEILANSATLQNLAAIFTRENMNFMGNYSRILAGKNGISSVSNDMNNFLQARFDYRQNALEKDGVDIIEILDSTNEALMAQYIVYLQDMQAIYLSEILAIYISKNVDKIEDATLKNHFATLIINESGLFTTMSQEDSFAKLNDITREKFEAIKKLFKNTPSSGVLTNWVTDMFDNADSGEYSSVKEEFKNTLPAGDWITQHGEIYIWDKVNDYFTYKGSFDGTILKASYALRESSFDVTSCKNVAFLFSSTTSLVCKELDYKKLMEVKNSSNFGYTVVTPYNYPEVNIEKIEFNSRRITIPKDATHAIDSSGKLYFKSGKNQNQIVQYNFHNGEKALFQFSTKNASSGLNQAFSRVAVDCGVATGNYVSDCNTTSSNETSGKVGGHSVITLESKSGQKVMIKIGGRGSENSSNIKAYMDTCEAPNINQSTCRDDT